MLRISQTLDNPIVSELRPWAEKQFIAYELLNACASAMTDNTAEKKAEIQRILDIYLNHPKVLCDFSLQAFAEGVVAL